MKNTTSITRLLLLAILGFLILNFVGGTSDQWVFIKYPILWLIWGIYVLFLIAIEVVMAAMQRVLFESLSPEQQKNYLLKEKRENEKRYAWFKRKYESLLDSKPMESEEEILLDHNYDGIRELDNNLPPWWKYLFYITIVFAGWYMVYYHILGGPNQTDEYEREVAAAEIALQKYKEENKDLVDASTVEMLTESSDLDNGKVIFDQNCAACHRTDGGGGIGPNLTDDYWILGGGIKNIYHTISEGGRSGKGMIPWKGELKPDEIAQVASYIITLEGSNPADPKDPEGEKWEDGDKLIH